MPCENPSKKRWCTTPWRVRSSRLVFNDCPLFRKRSPRKYPRKSKNTQKAPKMGIFDFWGLFCRTPPPPQMSLFESGILLSKSFRICFLGICLRFESAHRGSQPNKPSTSREVGQRNASGPKPRGAKRVGDGAA